MATLSTASEESVEIQIEPLETQPEDAPSIVPAANDDDAEANAQEAGSPTLKKLLNAWDIIDDNVQVDITQHHHDNPHAHLGKFARAAPALVSGFTNGSILFVFCCVFSSNEPLPIPLC